MERQQEKAAVQALIDDYVHAIDDERYEDWPEFFAERCIYRVATRDSEARGYPAGILHCSSKGMLKDRVNSLRKANIYEPHRYRHLLGPTRLLDVSEEGLAHARTGFAVVRIMQGGATDLFLSGVYEDRIELGAEGARFAERVVVLDSSQVDTLIVLPV